MKSFKEYRKYLVHFILWVANLTILLFPLNAIDVPAIQRQQIEQQRQIQREQSLETQQRLDRPLSLGNDTWTDTAVDDQTACVLIKQIEPAEFTHLTHRQRQTLIEPYQNRCLTMKAIQQLIEAVMRYYQTQGWITTQVGLAMPQNKLKQNILVLSIHEGLVERVELNSDVHNPVLLKHLLFDDLVNEPLNMRSWERRLEHINRLASHQAKLTIKPGIKKQHSIIEINDTTRPVTPLSLSIDNSGAEATGKNKVKLSFFQDDFLLPLGRLNLGYGESAHVDETQLFSDSYSLGYSFPYHGFLWEYAASKSDYRTHQTLDNGDIFYSLGQTTEQSFYTAYEIFRNNQGKNSVKLGLTLRDEVSETEILDIRTESEVGTRKLSIASLAYQHLVYLGEQTLYINPSVRLGLNDFDALSDDDVDYNEKAQFKSLGLYGYLITPIKLADKKLRWQTTWDMQVSEDNLFGSEQFGVGGQYSVRGFKEESLSGKSGFWIQNEWLLSLNNWLDLQGTPDFHISGFLDYGELHSNQYTNHKFAGAGMKLASYHQNLIFSLTLAKALVVPEVLDNEGWVAHFSFGIQF